MKFNTTVTTSTLALAALLGWSMLAWSQNTPGGAAGSSAKSAAPPGAASTGAAKAAAGAHTAKSADGKAAGDSKAQASYSLGVSMGDQLHRMGLTPDSVAAEAVTRGLRDALSGKVTMSAEQQERIVNLIKTARTNLAETNHKAADAFLAENGKKQGVVTTTSGLQYHVLAPGTGDPPKPTDQVTVNYRGTLLDGTEFDSSYKRGQPAQFPVNGVIPGWQEALVLMKPGSKWELFIPPKLAYDLNSPPAIPPGSLLRFEVELVKVNQPQPAAPKAPAAQPQ